MTTGNQKGVARVEIGVSQEEQKRLTKLGLSKRACFPIM